MWRMSAVSYPVAANAEAALHAPVGRAAREREAAKLAGEAVHFVTEQTGPAFPSQEAALDAWRGRVDDLRPGKGVMVAPEDRFCDLREVMAEGAGRPPRPQKPVMRAGRRWPQPREAPKVVWRLQVSYWRIGKAEAAGEQARALRRKAAGAEATPDQLRRVAGHPLRPVKPQQALDIGLFEARRPEDPDLIVPDE